MAIASGSANGSAAAATVTPESSASQPRTATTHIAAIVGRSSGSRAQSPGSHQAPNHRGRSSSRPSAMTTSGTSGLYWVMVREPTFELILRCRTPPAPPCSTSPTNALMWECPVIGTK